MSICILSLELSWWTPNKGGILGFTQNGLLLMLVRAKAMEDQETRPLSLAVAARKWKHLSFLAFFALCSEFLSTYDLHAHRVSGRTQRVQCRN